MLKYILLPLMFATVALAADFVPPPEAISLEDSRMAVFYSNPENHASFTGKFVDFPDELKAKIVLTCFEPALVGNKTQVSREVPVAEDGSFQIAFEDTVPLRKVLLRIASIGAIKGRSISLVLSKGIHFECKYLPEKLQLTISIDGPDEELNTVVEGFERYEREKKSALMKRLPTAANKTENFDAALTDINEAKQGLDELLRAYAPAKFGWVLQQELDARYSVAVLSTAFNNKQSLEGKSEWAKVLAFRPCVLGTFSLMYYSYLNMYLNRTTDNGVFRFSNQELQAFMERRLQAAGDLLKPAYEEFMLLMVKSREGLTIDQVRFKELSDQLSEAGVMRPDARAMVEFKIKRYRGRVADEKLDFILLQELPQAPEEALEALQPIGSFIGERWPKLVAAQAMPRLTAQAAKVNAVLAKATTKPADGLGVVPLIMPSGAKLYRLPELSGAELLTRIKETFHDKALIIDFWGPWCSPCMGDLPNSEKAHAAVKDLPVEFVYLGCRTGDAPWKEAIARLGLSGTHFLLTDRQDNELMAFFKNTGYPSYIFIDRKGELRPGAIKRFSGMPFEELRRLIE